MKRTTRAWVRHDGVCFHCQQCAEKYLKGLLEEHGHAVPKGLYALRACLCL
jgi:HEPN domain-containing protein